MTADSAATGRRPLLVSKWWVQTALLVFLSGFFVLGLLAYRTYTSDPPIPDKAVLGTTATIFTADDVRDGQNLFLRNGLMEYGSIFGHGAYLGPDFTADYLHRAAVVGPRPLRRHRPGNRQDDRGLPDQPLRLEDQDADADPGAGLRVRRGAEALRGVLRQAQLGHGAAQRSGHGRRRTFTS